MSFFEEAFSSVLKQEGGYSNNPHDSGGATNFGITKSVLQAWRGKPVTADDVKSMSLDEAKSIYRAWYWNVLSLDSIKNKEVAIMLFDQSVNRGSKTAAYQLQKVMNSYFGCSLGVDGNVGPKTIEAVNAASPKYLILNYVCSSQDAYADIVVNNPSQLVFLKGWLNRTQDLLKLVIQAS